MDTGSPITVINLTEAKQLLGSQLKMKTLLTKVYTDFKDHPKKFLGTVDLEYASNRWRVMHTTPAVRGGPPLLVGSD